MEYAFNAWETSRKGIKIIWGGYWWSVQFRLGTFSTNGLPRIYIRKLICLWEPLWIEVIWNPQRQKSRRLLKKVMLRLHCTPAFTKSFEIPITPQPSTSEVKKPENVFAGRADLFRKAVADNLLPCDLKTGHW